MSPALRLDVVHETVYAHPAPVELAQHVAFLVPRDTEAQQVLQWQLAIDPLPDGWAAASWEAQRQLSRDAFGNARLVFGHSRVHQQLSVISRFAVQRLPRPRLDLKHSPPWEQVAALLRYRAGRSQQPEAEFCLASPYTQPDAAISRMAHEVFGPGLPLAAAARRLCQHLHRAMRYLPDSTEVHTTAAQAWAQRRGVCQDYAQVAIAACRSLGLAARYVSGYLLTVPPPGQPKLMGADASHAWFEVWCPEQGWLGLDPTNDLEVAEQHALLAWGRDQSEVAPLRGVIRGGGQAEPQVAVTVTAC